MFTKKYWMSWWKADKNLKQIEKNAKKGDKKGKKSKRAVTEVMEDYLNDDKSASLNSVKKEKRKVKEAEREGVICEGLRVIGLKKTYFKKSFGRKSAKDVQAVRGIYLEVPDRELLCLLGHNGAGKSTLFSMLTGVA